MKVKMIKMAVLVFMSAILACGTKSQKSTLTSLYNVAGKDTVTLSNGLKYM